MIYPIWKKLFVFCNKPEVSTDHPAEQNFRVVGFVVSEDNPVSVEAGQQLGETDAKA